ncbi:hypothetical protein ONZ43_g3129 [Nemania bipapillata]|uniref:Uncharacterized protein n=1 Tax=Nemania bipapillata TaxID=110536 RepID=A0ACC2IYM3_9PEZI|nr:hypothetical protein ONZ43_g3129 [Nemania bipapillata]
MTVRLVRKGQIDEIEHGRGGEFLRRDRAVHILEDKLYTSILGPIIPAASDVEKDILARKILTTPGLAIILILILFSGDSAMITGFERNLLRSTTQIYETPGKALPLSLHESRDVFGHESGDKFFALQSRHLGIDLHEKTFRRELDGSQCLPYLEDSPIRPRSYVKVQKVVIERGQYVHLMTGSRPSRNGDVSETMSMILSLY